MPRYGIVADDGKTITDIIVVPYHKRLDGPDPSPAVVELDNRAKGRGDRSKCVTFTHLPTEGKSPQAMGKNDRFEWNEAQGKVVIKTGLPE